MNCPFYYLFMDKKQKEKYVILKKLLNEKYDKYGIESFSEKELLSLILSITEPVFADIITDKIIDTFGSLENVFFAEPENLINACGISLNTAVLIKAIPIISYIRNFNNKTNICLNSSYLAKLYFSDLFSDAVNEQFAAVAVNSDFSIISKAYILTGGTINSIACSNADIASYALNCGAERIFIAHCHPDGDCTPSDADIHSTKELISALEKLGISVTDHIIIGKNSAYSMRAQAFENIFKPVKGYSE